MFELSDFVHIDTTEWRWGMIIPLISLGLCLAFALLLIICCCCCVGNKEKKQVGIYCKNCDSVVDPGVFTITKPERSGDPICSSAQSNVPLTKYEQRSSFYYERDYRGNSSSADDDTEITEDGGRIRTEIVV